MNDIVKLALDTYHGTIGNYSVADANEVLRKALMEVAGSEDGTINFKNFRRNKTAVFEIIEETLEKLVVEGLEDQFSGFAEVRNLKLGDTNTFHIPNNDLLKVATISDGNGNLRRQRLKDGKEITIATSTMGIKIYEEFNRFLSGRINWIDMVNRISKSFNVKLANEVYDAVYNSYDQLTAPYQLSGTYSEADLIDIASHVEASTGSSVKIFGTKKALAQVTPSVISDSMRDKRNDIGYYGVVAGYELHEIKQSHKIGTDTFAINDKFLMILPEVENKFVKIVNEGEAIVQEVAGGQSADMSLEYMFQMKQGIAVISNANYGIFRMP